MPAGDDYRRALTHSDRRLFYYIRVSTYAFMVIKDKSNKSSLAARDFSTARVGDVGV